MDAENKDAVQDTEGIEELQARFQKELETIEDHRNVLQDIANQLRKEKSKAVIPREVATEAARKMGPMDDPFFTKIGEDSGAIEEIISTAIGVPIEVKKVIPQYTIPGFGTRGVRLDSFSEVVPRLAAEVELCEGCELGDKGALIDVEVQKDDRDDTEYRVYYNGASIIVSSTPPGIEDYREIPRAVVIWISATDPFGEGEMVYQTVKTDGKSGNPRKSPVTEIYINTKNISESGDTKNDRIAKLMRLFKNPDEYNFTEFPKFSKRKQELRTTEEGVLEVSSEYQQIIDNEREEGKKEGQKEGREETGGLMNFLWSNGRGEEAQQAMKDESLFKRLLSEFRASTLTANAQ